MRKIYALLKQYVLASILLFIATIVIYSCKKDKGSSINQDSKEIIADAKSYFEQKILNKSLRIPNDPNFRHSIIKKPVWSRSVIRKISLGDAVVVPIVFDEDIFTMDKDDAYKSFLSRTSYLMIYKDKKENMHAEWVTLLNIKVKKNRNEHFSGIAVIEEWNGTFKKAFAFDGLGNYEKMSSSSSITRQQISYSRFITCVTIPHYSTITVGGISTSSFRGSETFCYGSFENSGDEGGNGSTYGYGHSGGEQQDEEVDPSNYLLYFIDCNGDIDGSAIIDDNCGCIQGNTGIQSCADITDKIKNKCLDSVWIKVKDTLNNKIANILNNTFNTSDKINFKIVDGNIDGGYSAKTEVVTDKVNSDGIHIFDVKVTLNKNTLPSASQEFIATTMVHEIMHAYFDSQKTYYTQQFQQHRNMAENYIDDLKNAVQAIYSSLDDKAAYALILNGFGDIFKNDLTYWNSLVSKYDLDTAQIINIRDDHKTHNSGTKTACSQ
ncbi:hypothetical protein [Pedobacter sp. BMA]|uniref:hypothetical protein n=1 Tax=Pedobacter sp. BMA TaxID=1663685 RepID=UPI00064A55F5|nr:hypothetical protein [Pedobacter sp. BMA]KLT66452.1 hypothetical protein AB669_04425 [Pedobacter sp. BMA]